MPIASSRAEGHVARLACLLALAPLVGVTLLLLAALSPSGWWFVGLNALLIAAIVRAAVILPYGGDAAFALLWLAIGLTLSVSVLTALSAAPAFLLTLAMLIVAVGTAPNRTGRSRGDWRFVVAPAAVFAVSIALLLYVLG